jgi:hypothetical protein
VKNKGIGPPKFLAVVLCLSLAIVGCTASSVISQINNWEPVIAKAFNYIVGILQQDGVLTNGASLSTDSARVSAGIGDLTSDVTAAMASSSAATGALNKTIAVLSSLQNDLGQLQTDIPGGIPATDAQDVKQSLGGLILALGVFQADLTPVASLPFDQQKKALAKIAVPDLAAFKKSWNQIQVTHNHPEKQL